MMIIPGTEEFKKKIKTLREVTPYYVTISHKRGLDRSYNSEIFYVDKEDDEYMCCYRLNNDQTVDNIVIESNNIRLLEKKEWNFVNADNFVSVDDEDGDSNLIILEGIGEFTKFKSKRGYVIANIKAENETHLKVLIRPDNYYFMKPELKIIPKVEYKFYSAEDYPEKII